jgi:hypothetical protein
VALGLGFIPQPYYSFIGQMADQYGGNTAYKDVIEAAFQNNNLIRLNSEYVLSGSFRSFRIGLSASYVQSAGTAGIDKVLAASNGKDYTNLKNLLVALGRSPNVDIKSSLITSEIYLDYDLGTYSGFQFLGSLGFVKIISADVNLKSGLSNFEASVAGNDLMRSSESETEGIVIQNGMSPTLGLRIIYQF